MIKQPQIKRKSYLTTSQEINLSQEILNKAVSEHWSLEEFNHMLEDILTEYNDEMFSYECDHTEIIKINIQNNELLITVGSYVYLETIDEYKERCSPALEEYQERIIEYDRLQKLIQHNKEIINSIEIENKNWSKQLKDLEQQEYLENNE